MYIENEVIESLEVLPNECEYIDYKQVGYSRDKANAFIKDVISMLNSYQAFNRNRFIIIGVDDKNKSLLGISDDMEKDDNEYQNWIQKINPVPIINTGHVDYKGKRFEFICINKENDGEVYEVARGVDLKALHQGQAFYRQGSQNAILPASGREKIRAAYLEKQKYREHIFELIDSYNDDGIPPIIVALMIEAWDIKYKGDKEFIELLISNPWDMFQKDIRTLHRGEHSCINIKGSQGEVKNRNNILEFTAVKFYDDYWDRFESTLKVVINSIGNNLSKPKGQRGILVLGEEGLYSQGFLKGVYDFIAFVSTHKELFGSCNTYRIENLTYECLATIFNSSDWKVWGTLEPYIDSIIEWKPDLFLGLFRESLQSDDNVFKDLLNEKTEGIIAINYGNKLCNGLQKLAYYNEYFTSSLNILFQLSKFRKDIIESIIMILLPAHPLTKASLDSRYNIVRGFFKDDLELGWSIGVQLLPNKIFLGQAIQGLKYRDEISPVIVPGKEYMDISRRYFSLLLEYANNDDIKLSALLSDFWHMFFDMQIKLIDCIKAKTINNKQISFELYLSLVKVRERYYLYQRVGDTSNKEIIDDIKNIIDKIEGINPEFKNKLLFQKDGIFLFKSIKEIQKRQEVISKLQQDLLKEKIDKGELITFISEVEDKSSIGFNLGKILKSEDDFWHFFYSLRKESSEVFMGFINSVSQFYPEYICRYIEANLVDDEFLSALVINDLIYNSLVNKNWIDSIDKLKLINVYRLNLTDAYNITQYIKILINHQLYEQALFSTYIYLDKIDININDLMKGLENLEEINCELLDEYILKELILYCENQGENSKRLGMIECKFIELFRYDKDCQLNALNNLLFYDLSLFIDLVKSIFRIEDDSDEVSELKGDIQHNRIVHYYNILSKWISIESSIDSDDDFSSWFECVYYHAIQVKRLNIVLELLGKKLFHVKSDEICNFLAKAVVDLLERPELESLRRGYIIEAFNSRGVHWHSDVDDRDTYNFYFEKFLYLSENGYYYTADVYKRIANEFSYSSRIENI